MKRAEATHPMPLTSIGDAAGHSAGCTIPRTWLLAGTLSGTKESANAGLAALVSYPALPLRQTDDFVHIWIIRLESEPVLNRCRRQRGNYRPFDMAHLPCDPIFLP